MTAHMLTEVNSPRRPLEDIYAELGRTLLEAGHSASEEPTRMKRYAQAAQAFRDAVVEAPTRADLYECLGIARQAQQRSEDAMDAFLSAIEREPSRLADVLLLAEPLLSPALAKSMSSALSPRLNKLAELDLDEDSRHLLERFNGRFSLQVDDLTAALSFFERAIRRVPGDFVTHEAYAEALRRSKRHDEAAAQLERAADLAEPQALATALAIRGQLCDVMLEQGRFAEVLPIARTAAKQALPPVSGRFLLTQAKAYLGLRWLMPALRAAEAADACWTQAVSDADHAEAHATHATILLRLDRFEAAADAAVKSLEVAPLHLDALAVRAEALLACEEQGTRHPDISEIVRNLRTYLAYRPKDFERHQLLIRSMQRLGATPDELVDAVQAAISYAPAEKQPRLLTELAANMLAANRKPEEIEEHLRKAETLDASIRTPEWWRLLAEVQRLSGDVTGAIETYENALTALGSDADLLRAAARLWDAEQELPGEALRLWRELANLEPWNEEAQVHLARALLRTGEATEACAILQDWLPQVSDATLEAEASDMLLQLIGTLQVSDSERAEAYFEIGVRRYQRLDAGREDFGAARKLLERAIELQGELTPAEWHWHLAEATRLESWSPVYPYADAELAKRGLGAWSVAGPPTSSEYAWAYQTRALLAEQFSRLSTGAAAQENRWEGVVYAERSLALGGNPDAATLAIVARQHRLLRNMATALDLTEGAVDSGDVAALDERSAVLANVGRFEEAEKLLDDRDPNAENSSVTWMRAYVKLYLGEFDSALTSIETVMLTEPDDVWNEWLRGTCLLRMGKLAEARAQFERIWQRRDEEAVSRRAKNMVGTAAYRLGLFDDAIAILTQALDDPSYDAADLWQFIGLARLSKGEIEPARVALERSLQLARTTFDVDVFLEQELRLAGLVDAEALRVVGAVRRLTAERRAQLIEHPSAEVELTEMLRNCGERRDTWAWLGAQVSLARVHAGARNWDAAATIYSDVALEDQQHTPPRFPEAGRCLQRILEAQSGDYQRAGDVQRTIDVERRLSELVGKQEIVSAIRVSNALEAAGDLHSAIATLQDALRRSNDAERGADASTRLGDLLVITRRFDAARTAYEAALSFQGLVLDPDLSVRLALVAASSGNFVGARDHLRAMCEAVGPDTLASVLTSNPQNGARPVLELLRAERDAHAFAAALRLLTTDRSLDRNVRNQLVWSQLELAGRHRMARWRSRSPEPAIRDRTAAVRPIKVEVDSRLFPEDEPALRDAFITEELTPVRSRVEEHMGVKIPAVRMHPVPASADATYRIQIQGEVRHTRGIPVDQRFCPDAAGCRALGLTGWQQPTPDETREGMWIAAADWTAAESAGLTLWNPRHYLALDIQHVVQRDLARLFGLPELREAVNSWLAARPESRAEIKSRAVPDDEPGDAIELRLVRVARRLLGEHVPIWDWEQILNAFAESRVKYSQTLPVVEAVRKSIRPDLPGAIGEDSHWCSIPELEREVAEGLEQHDTLQVLVLSQAAVTTVQSTLFRHLERLTTPRAALVVEDSSLRPYVRQVAQLMIPDVPVVARDEILDG